jgi:hypothetical protein
MCLFKDLCGLIVFTCARGQIYFEYVWLANVCNTQNPYNKRHTQHTQGIIPI